MRKWFAEMNDRPGRQKSFGLAPMLSAMRHAFSTLDFPQRSSTKKSPGTQKPAGSTSAIRFEAMEPRILLAADPVFAVSGAISAPGETDHHNFTLASDSKVVFDSLTNNADLDWSLAGSNGNVVSTRSFVTSDSSDLSGSPAIALTPGDYTIAVNGSLGATGSYRFRLLDLQSADAIAAGTAVTGQINPANETDAYKFDATAGDHFFLDVTGRSGGDITWQLLDSAGQQVFGPTVMNSASQDVDVPVLATTGTYTLLVEGKIGAVEAANYSFTAQLLPPGYVPPTAPVTTNTWIGPAGGNLNVAANWSKGSVPVATDNVYIGLPAGQVVTVTSGTVTVNSLTCDSDLTLSTGATMNLNGVSKVKGNLVLAGGTLGGTGTLTVTGSFDVTSGSTLSGTHTLITQSTSLITSNLNFHGTWINQGTLTVSSGGYLYFGAYGGGDNTLINAAGATLNLSGIDDGNQPIRRYAGTATLNNHGTLNQTTTGVCVINSGITFNNVGEADINVSSGGSLLIVDDFTVEAGSTLTLSGSGAVKVLHFLSGTTTINGTVRGAGNFELAEGTLTGTGTIGCDMTMSGNISVVGTLTTLSATNVVGGVVVSGGGTWVNRGTLTVSGNGLIIVDADGDGNGTLTNVVGATLNLTSTVGWPIGVAPAATFNNHGTLNQTA